MHKTHLCCIVLYKTFVTVNNIIGDKTFEENK